MKRQHSLRNLCIRDRDAAYATLGVGFWFMLTATLFAVQALTPHLGG